MRRTMLAACLGVLIAVSSVPGAEDFNAVYKKGYAAFRARKNAEAKQCFLKAVEAAEKPAQKAQALLYVGYVEERLKDNKAALETFGKILAMKDAGPGMRSAALLYTGHSLSRLRKYDEALKAYRDTVAVAKGRSRDRLDAAFAIASILASRKKDYKGAEAELAKILAMPKLSKHRKGQALYALGGVYSGQKQYAKACEHFERVVQEGNSYYASWALYRLGQCRTQEKQPDKARAAYERLMKMGGAYKKAQRYAAKELKALDKTKK